MTGEYAFATPERQNELTRRIQEKLSEAGKKIGENPAGTAPNTDHAGNPPSLATTAPVTTLVQ